MSRRASAWQKYAWSSWAAACVLAAAATFYIAALLRTDGHAPVPLDDAYTYFGFARSTALGHPMEPFPGGGYSSGATSPLYTFLLAPLWLAGLRGEWLALGAAVLAVLFLFDAARSLASLVPRGAVAARWVVPPLVVSVPLLDWSFFSSMETAFVAAVLGRALGSAGRALDAEPGRRSRAQLSCGGWLFLLATNRPETVGLALALGIAVARGARARSVLAALARVLGPLVAGSALIALIHWTATGEAAPAGAVRKLLGSNPYAEPTTQALAFARNMAVLTSQAFERALGGTPWALALPALGVFGLRAPRRAPIAVALAFGAASSLALVCLNATARYQNFRYAAPTLLMLVALATMGLSSALRRRSRGMSLIGAALAVIAIVAPLRELPRQVGHFAQASRNIVEQQGEVARRVAALGARLVFVNDAGAIPYLSEVPALDGLGLGGYHGLPFARASVHGPPAVVELVERLPADARPDVLAIYPAWWPGLPELFGRAVERVHIDGNVICGADDAWLYAADWSTLEAGSRARPGELDSLDVADLVDEHAHDYRPPVHGGFAIGSRLALPDGELRWDGGRIIGIGEREDLRIADGLARGPATLVLRTDTLPSALAVEVVDGDGTRIRAAVDSQAITAGSWTELSVRLEMVCSGCRLRIGSDREQWRSFHAWLLR